MSLFKNIHRFLNRESQNHGAALHAVQFCSMGKIPGRQTLLDAQVESCTTRTRVKEHEISSNREATQWAGEVQVHKKGDSWKLGSSTLCLGESGKRQSSPLLSVNQDPGLIANLENCAMTVLVLTSEYSTICHDINRDACAHYECLEHCSKQPTKGPPCLPHPHHLPAPPR